MTTNRLDWTIKKTNKWFATHVDGCVLVSQTKEGLMKKINEYENNILELEVV